MRVKDRGDESMRTEVETDVGKITKQMVMKINLKGIKKSRIRLRLARPLLMLAMWVAGLGGYRIKESDDDGR